MGNTEKVVNTEKVDESLIENLESAEKTLTKDSAAINDERINYFTPEEQKKIIRRIDIRLTLLLGCMYCVSLMDRTNLGIAVVAGMSVDMVLTGERYSIIVLIFFITYVLLQPPATVILRKVGPRIFLPSITMLWGMVMIAFGFVKVWTDLLALRLVLGVFEAGFFPGCAYLLSCWYPRYDLQKRNAVFYLIGSMASAFSGILAYGFSQLQNHGSGPAWWGQLVVPTKANPDIEVHRMPGIAGWRWIFILQGVITCVVALIGYFFVVDFPEKATSGIVKFLTQRESDFIVARIEKDRHDAIPEEFKLGAYLSNALDLKVWGFACLFGLTTTSTYAISYFLPIILKDGMGFSVAAAQCLVAPPYVLAAIVMFAFAWYGDKWHIRSPFVILNGFMTLLGIALLGYVENVGVRYFGVFLATSACNANVPCVLTWQANNIRGQWKRALCSATLVGFGGLGGIIGGTVFRSQDAPEYRPGIWSSMGAAALTVVISLMMVYKFHRANKRVDAGGKPIEGLVGFKTVDTRIKGFYDEVIVLRSTYDGLSKSLETPILLEAARVASKTPDGGQLWDQVRIALDDSLHTVNRINQVLDKISKKSGFARKVKTVLEENLRDGELYLLRQRVQFFNVTISLPIQMMGLMLQLEQRNITVEHQRSLESKFTSLECEMRHLINHPDRVSMYSGATLIVGATDENPDLSRGETYLSFAKKILSTASAAASTRSCISTGSRQLAPPTLNELGGPEPVQQSIPERRESIPDWIPHPETSLDSPSDIQQTTSSSVAPLDWQRVPGKSAEVAYKLTQQHLKLAQEKAEKNEHESAERSFKKALQLLAKHDFSGRIAFQPAEVILLLSKSCLEQKKYDEAIEILSPVAQRQANIIPRSILPLSTDPSAPILTPPGSEAADALQALAASQLLGEAYKLKGDLESAKEHALTAFLKRMDELGEHDQKTHESVRLVIEIFQLMGDEEEAEAYQVFLSPTPADPVSSVNSHAASPEEPVSTETHTRMPSIAPTTSEVANSSVPRQGKSNRPSFTRRLRNIARPSQGGSHPQNSDHDTHRVSFSHVGTRDSITPDTCLDSRPSQHFSTPSDTSHDRTNSFVLEGGSDSLSIGHLERSASVKLLEPEFLAISQLCDSGSYDQAVKIALKFLERYEGSNFVIRKDEIEKNIRKGTGKGLARTGKGYSPLHYMCELKHEYIDEVCLLLRYGADVNARAGKASYGTKANDTLTPLQLAVDRGHTGIAQLLLETPGIRTDIHNGEHWYPLLRAGRKRQYGTVKLLLKHGASSIPKTYPQDYYGCTPLHDAAKHCDLTLVQIFIDNVHVDPDRLNVNVQDKFGKAALMHAIIKSDVSNPEMKAQMTKQRKEVISALLDAGADVQLLDFEGHSARWYAERENESDTGWLCELIGAARYELMG
ncbi:hypothetical protein DV738_g3136, partial [Chaetothyriales sp. CBS 135597]